MKKIALCLMILLLLSGCRNSKVEEGESIGSALQTIAPKADFTLIPVYTMDERSVYLNAAVTPLLFFSLTCPSCIDDLPKLQELTLDLKPQKTLVYVATFFKTTDLKEAIEQTNEFIEKYNIQGTVVIQAGPPKTYVEKVPSLVTLDNGKDTPNIVTGMPSKDVLVTALFPDTSEEAKNQ